LADRACIATAKTRPSSRLRDISRRGTANLIFKVCRMNPKDLPAASGRRDPTCKGGRSVPYRLQNARAAQRQSVFILRANRKGCGQPDRAGLVASTTSWGVAGNVREEYGDTTESSSACHPLPETMMPAENHRRQSCQSRCCPPRRLCKDPILRGAAQGGRRDWFGRRSIRPAGRGKLEALV